MTDLRPQDGQAAPRDRDVAKSQFGVTFWVTVGISVAFVLAGVVFTEPFGAALAAVVGGIVSGLGWLYLLVTSVLLVFVLYLAFGRFGNVRLGGPDAKPEFSLIPWFCMLFQAGMGIGLLFWGVAEPLLHYRNPPFGLAEAGSPEAASLGLQYAFFHWSLHPWAIYAVVGLAVAYFSFNKGMQSLQLSSVFRPLIGDRVDGWMGKAIDVLTIVATLFGVAVSLGLGTLQINAGLGETFGLPSGTGLQLVIIVVTGASYMLSASTPIEKGINWLSQASMVLATILLLYFLVGVGPTLLALNSMTQEIGNYLVNLVPMSLRTSAFEPTPWLGDWTIFFWATWIAWAPYVGAFIARISRGRTIREFVLGVLIAPTLFTVVWFSTFGSAAIDADNRVNGAISDQAAQDEALALFAFIDQYPGSLFLAILSIVLIWIFFVAGADAGTVVLGSMSGGVLDPAVAVKLTWGVIMAAIAGILLVVGGLDALQNGAILAATPFVLLLLAICWALYRVLSRDFPAQPAGPGPRQIPFRGAMTDRDDRS